MRKKILQDQIKKKLIKNIIIVGALLALMVGSIVFDSMKTDEAESNKNQVNSINGEIAGRKEEYVDSEAKYQEYLDIPAYKMPSKDGYATTKDRISILIPEMKRLKALYVFKKLNYSLSEIKESTNINSSLFKAYEDIITIEFSGVNDEYVFSFINDLKEKLPGFINIKSYKIDKDAEIDDGTIKSFLSSGGTGFVSGAIVLNWVTLKSPTNENNVIPENQ